MYEALNNSFSNDAEIIMGESGMEIAVKLKGDRVLEKIENSQIAVNILEASENAVTMLISCSKIETENIYKAIQKLNDSLQIRFSVIKC